MFGFSKIETVELTVKIGKHWAVDALAEKWAAKYSVIGLHMNVEDQTVSYTVHVKKTQKSKLIWDVERLVGSGIMVEIKEKP